MCNEAKRLQHLSPYMRGCSVSEMFSQLYVKPEFRYENAWSGHCMVCKSPLAYHEMWPKGKCPRSMCDHCYQKEVVGKINYNCIVSGAPLQQEQIEAQKANPREVGNNIAEGFARDYYTLLCGKILGLDMSFLKTDNDTRAQNVPMQQIQHHVQDYIDVPYTTVTNHSQSARRISAPQPKALPPPQEQLKVPNMIFQRSDAIPVPRTYRGKKVVRIDGDKNKYG